jgi:hypothetical protein
MAAKNEAALEAEEEVLPDRLHRFEPTPVEPFRQPLHRGARMRRLDLESLADKRLQPAGRTMERIPFRHAGKPTIES